MKGDESDINMDERLPEGEKYFGFVNVYIFMSFKF